MGLTFGVLQGHWTWFSLRFSESIFDESEEHTYEMEYEEPKNDGQHVQVLGKYDCFLKLLIKNKNNTPCSFVIQQILLQYCKI